MKNHSILLAIILGLAIPWILFSGRETTFQNAPIAETQIIETTVCVNNNTILVSMDDGQVRELALEEYLLGVLAGEMPESFELEALKAQAVVARTFSIKSIQNGYKHTGFDVCTDSSCCQAYYSPDLYEAAGGSLEKYRRAISETAGEVLLYDNELIEATYFSCSGGMTEDAAAVWGMEIPYLRSVESPGEEQASHYMDTIVMDAEELEGKLGASISGVPGSWIGDVTYTAGGGVKTIKIGGIVYSGSEIRKKLGLNSTAFVISIVGERVTITTKGFGHRVGMSQYGADAMAVLGNSYSYILSYYYPDTQLKVYENV